MTALPRLHHLLLSLDRCSYKAYRSIQGDHSFPEFTLAIDRVQGDPFAAPSRLRVLVPQARAQFPPALYQSHSREVALRDYLHRQFDRFAHSISEKRGSGKSGLIAIAPPTQQVLERTAVLINAQQVEVRFRVGLPARGRTILGQQAAALLCEDLPWIVQQSLFYSRLEAAAIQQHVETVEDADWLRQQLSDRGLVAFIPNGAILPRQSSIHDQPLQIAPQSDGAIPFQSPPSLQVQFDRPNQGRIMGMGIPQGITLIVGGGYHGKSTLLKAIALGIYNHIPGDGREQVVTQSTAIKIRAEEGRSITGVNISPFINHLPQGRSTTRFSSTNASGSTSQAANVMESLEMGAKLLLMDEDTSASNFMIRDRRMQALIAKHQEPITPLIDKIQQLYQEHQVSTVLVMGGSGDYFDVADTIIALQEFQLRDVTLEAKKIAQIYRTQRIAEGGDQFGEITARIPQIRVGNSKDKSDFQRSDPSETQEKQASYQPYLRIKVRDSDELILGDEWVDLSAVEQIIDKGQLQAIGTALHYVQTHDVQTHGLAEGRSLAKIVAQVMADLDSHSLDVLADSPQGDFTQFRGLDLAMVINRLRSLKIHQELWI